MSYLRRLTFQFAAVLLITLLTALAASSWFTLKAFERELVPEIENKAVTLGRSLSGLIGRAVSHDMSLGELVGVGDLLRAVITDNREIGLLAITDNAGKVRHESGPLQPAVQAYLRSTVSAMQPDAQPEGTAGRPPVRQVSGYYMVSLPIDVQGTRHGYLHIGAKASFVQSVLQENLLDVLVVLVVAFFIAVEIAYLFAGRSAALQLASLMRTASAAAAGTFDRRLAPATLQALGPVATAIDRALAGVNVSYEHLLRQVRAAWHRRQTDGSQAVRRAVVGLRALRERYRFGAGAHDDISNKLGLIRAPLFLFLLAEDLSRSFIPMYAAELFSPVPGLSVKLVLSLPIILFMLVVALSQPLVGGWSERVGRRQSLLAGAGIGVVAHLASAFAFTLYDLLLWRSLAGVAWGVVFVAGQAYVLEHTNTRTRTRGLAFFVGVIMVASACGPSIGGILADGLGFRSTLIVSAILSAAAVWLVWTRLAPEPSVAAVARNPRPADFAALFANRRFVVFLLTAAMPAKIVLIAYCFYLIPLYMPDIGTSSAMAGRMIMLYALVMVVGVPFTARWSGEPSRRWLFVAAGLFLSGLAGLMPLWLPGTYAIMAMVILLGVAQSMSIAPQTAMVAQVCRAETARIGEGTVLGIYRLIERVGNVLGPLIAAILLQGLSYRETFAVIGLLMLCAGAVFTLTFRQSSRSFSALAATEVRA
jgi:predicted MFS family arabinose efflux permease